MANGHEVVEASGTHADRYSGQKHWVCAFSDFGHLPQKTGLQALANRPTRILSRQVGTQFHELGLLLKFVPLSG